MRAKFKRLLSGILIGYCVISQAVGQSRSSLLVKELSIKELREQLSHSKQDTAAVKLLFELGNRYTSKVIIYNADVHFNDSAVYFHKTAIQLGDSLHYNKFKKESSISLGKVCLLIGNLKEGKKWFYQVINYEHALYHKEKEADTWAMMGLFIPREVNYHVDIKSCLEKATTLYKELKLWDKEADVKLQFADIELAIGNYETCEKLLLEVLELYHRHGKKKTFNVHYLLSVSNRYDGDLSTALSYAMKCVNNMEELKDTINAAYFYGEMGLVYQGLNRTEESIYWYKRALDKRERTGDEKLFIYNTAGFLIQQLLHQQKEKEALDIIIRLRKQYPPIQDTEKASAAQSLARCYEAQKKYELAEKYYLEMIKYFPPYAQYREYLAIALQDIGSFYIHRKKYNLARPYLIRVLQMPPGTNISAWEKNVHLMLFEADSAQGNYIAAIHHLRKHNQLNDSIFNAAKIREIEKLQTQFKVAEKEKEIMTLNNDNKIQQQHMQQTAMVRNFVIAGILIVLGFVYYRYKLKQKSNLQLEAQQKEINKKNQHLEHLVKEREWLLKEIHHRVKNNFQMVTSLLGTQTHYIKSDEALQYIEESQHRVYAMSLIHQRLYLAGNYSSINMKNYIHELVDYLRNSIVIRQHILFEIDAEEIELDISHALPIGLILNESITNAIKYAFKGREEGKISIILRQNSEEAVLLKVSDNGIGLPAQMNMENSETMGMNLMKGLSEEIEGTFSIGTNNGTVIQLLFNYEFNQTLLPYSLPAL